jgi:hypothetical protein
MQVGWDVNLDDDVGIDKGIWKFDLAISEWILKYNDRAKKVHDNTYLDMSTCMYAENILQRIQ